jgi:hypothetical protein
VITATAPGRRPFSTRITAVEAKSATVEIPELEVEPDRPTMAPITTIRLEEDTLDPGRTRRILGLALGGAGIASLATGLGFGLAARSSWQSAFDDGLCDKDTLQCTREGQSRTSTARRHALVSDVVAGTGLALVAAGVILYITAPSKRTEIGITPNASGGASVTVGGVW